MGLRTVRRRIGERFPGEAPSPGLNEASYKKPPRPASGEIL